MIGKIASINEDEQTAVIENEEGVYDFNLAEWRESQGPYSGDEVLFEGNDGIATIVTLIGDYSHLIEPVKSRKTAILLAFLLGGVGAHRFYLGFNRIALIQIIVTGMTLGFGVLWGFIEGMLLLGGQIHQDVKGRPLK